MWLADKHNRVINEEAVDFCHEESSNRIFVFPKVAGAYVPNYTASHPKRP